MIPWKAWGIDIVCVKLFWWSLYLNFVKNAKILSVCRKYSWFTLLKFYFWFSYNLLFNPLDLCKTLRSSSYILQQITMREEKKRSYHKWSQKNFTSLDPWKLLISTFFEYVAMRKERHNYGSDFLKVIWKSTEVLRVLTLTLESVQSLFHKSSPSWHLIYKISPNANSNSSLLWVLFSLSIFWSEMVKVKFFSLFPAFIFGHTSFFDLSWVN